MQLRDFEGRMDSCGWALLPAAVPNALLERMLDDLDSAYAICRSIQEKNGVANDMVGTLHHLPALYRACPSFLEFLDRNPAAPYIWSFFGGHSILNSMGGNFNFPDAGNYASRVHRDVRSFSNDRVMINTLVALDPLTEKNGATWLMPGGHRLSEKPDDGEFDAQAIQVMAPAGSILMWDSRLWHRAGVNYTDKPRRIITPIFTRPWFKQGLDYPRAIGNDRPLSETLKQVIGYNARVPANLEEWYVPLERRAYRGDQG